MNGYYDTAIGSNLYASMKFTIVFMALAFSNGHPPFIAEA